MRRDQDNHADAGNPDPAWARNAVLILLVPIVSALATQLAPRAIGVVSSSASDHAEKEVSFSVISFPEMRPFPGKPDSIEFSAPIGTGAQTYLMKPASIPLWPHLVRFINSGRVPLKNVRARIGLVDKSPNARLLSVARYSDPILDIDDIAEDSSSRTSRVYTVTLLNPGNELSVFIMSTTHFPLEVVFKQQEGVAVVNSELKRPSVARLTPIRDVAVGVAFGILVALIAFRFGPRALSRMAGGDAGASHSAG